MSEDGKGGWERGGVDGRLERKYVGAHGQDVYDRFSAKDAIITRTERFPDGAVRNLVLSSDNHDDRENNPFRNWLLEGPAGIPTVRFEHSSLKAISNIELDKTGVVDISLLKVSKDKSLIETRTETDSLIDLSYDDFGLVSCTLQAETRAEINGAAEELDHSQDIEDLLRSMINDLKFSRKEELEGSTSAKRMLANEAIEDNPSPDGSVVRIAQSVVARAMNRVMEMAPPDDREEYSNFLTQSGFNHALLIEVFRRLEKGDVTGESLSAVNIGDLIKATIVEELESMADDRAIDAIHHTSVQLLGIDLFGEDTFSWREIEDDPSGHADFTRDLLHGDHPTGKEHTVRQDQTSHYGERVQVQENVFVVNRTGNMIQVECYGPGNKHRWEASFALKPQGVSFDEIKDVIKNPEKDFRDLKKLLPSNLIPYP